MQVLVEGFSKKSDKQLSGRTDTMKRAVLDDVAVPSSLLAATQADAGQKHVRLQPGDYVAVEIQGCTSGTLFAKPLCKTSLQAFAKAYAQCHAQAQEASLAEGSTLPRELALAQ